MSTIVNKYYLSLNRTVEIFSKYLCFYICSHTALLFLVGIYRKQSIFMLILLSLILNFLMMLINIYSRNESLKHNVIALVFMGQIMLLLAAFKNSPMIIDIHMYFFAALGNDVRVNNRDGETKLTIGVQCGSRTRWNQCLK